LSCVPVEWTVGSENWRSSALPPHDGQLGRLPGLTRASKAAPQPLHEKS